MLLNHGPSTPEKLEYFNKLRDAVDPSQSDLTVGLRCKTSRKAGVSKTIVRLARTSASDSNNWPRRGTAPASALVAQLSLSSTPQLVTCTSVPFTD